MSYANFVKALELAPQCKFYTTAGGKSDEEIGASEKILGVTFSKQCKEFYKKLGYLSFFGNEIFGIDPYDDSGILEGNSVAYVVGLVLLCCISVVAVIKCFSVFSSIEQPMIEAIFEHCNFTFISTVCAVCGYYCLIVDVPHFEKIIYRSAAVIFIGFAIVSFAFPLGFYTRA